MMFRVAEGEVAVLLAECCVAAKLFDHASVEGAVAAGHARFEFVAAAHRAINEEAELHGDTCVCWEAKCFAFGGIVWARLVQAASLAKPRTARRDLPATRATCPTALLGIFPPIVRWRNTRRVRAIELGPAARSRWR